MWMRHNEKFLGWDLVRDGQTYDLSLLGERERQAFILYCVLGVQQREVGEVMGITTVTAGQYIDNARKKFNMHWNAVTKLWEKN